MFSQFSPSLRQNRHQRPEILLSGLLLDYKSITSRLLDNHAGVVQSRNGVMTLSSIFAPGAQVSCQEHANCSPKWKKRSERRKHWALAVCSKAEPNIFAPPQTPFPWAQDDQNLISWRWSLPLPTNPIWWRSMHAVSSYRGNRPTLTNTQTNPQTGPITIHCAAASAQCKQNVWRLLRIPDDSRQKQVFAVLVLLSKIKTKI